MQLLLCSRKAARDTLRSHREIILSLRARTPRLCIYRLYRCSCTISSAFEFSHPLLEDLPTHRTLATAALAADPVTDAVHVEAVSAFSDDCLYQYCSYTADCLEARLTDGTIVAGVLALGAGPLELNTTDAAGGVSGRGRKIPLPFRDCAVGREFGFHCRMRIFACLLRT